ncbi:conserved unknown protein [Ectocarpus siliculosus]|uniref:Uncharacterized protein n=1 Tax=Ectocarpus siliculosus TaxID=2880 RepID=D7FT51_ECTSI|nr:conserved unknown protein [Ectocarpus siliculosus]|eukprot:CBJ49223.1 conserved unknown protein [Ectocarpus siliculosus]
MAKRGRGGEGGSEAGDKKKKKGQTQQNGSESQQQRLGDASLSPADAQTGAEGVACKKLPRRTDKVAGAEKGEARQAKGNGEKGAAGRKKSEKEDSWGGGGASCNSGRKRKKKAHEEEGYEGPVEEEDSDGSDASSKGGDDDSAEESDDSDDDIKLDGALTRRSDAEEDDEEEEEEEEEEAAGSGATAAGDQQTVVDVCLDFCDPHERFFHGIRALLAHSYLQEAAGAGLSPLVDLAVAQGAVGTVLSTDADDDAVFGFVTALPLKYLAKEHECVQAVTKFLLEKASKAGRGSEMEEVLGEGTQEKVGLLVSERMINCPMQAVPKLHEALVEDIAWAIENEISEEHREKFRFDKFIVVAPCDDAGGAGPGLAMLSDFYFSRFDDEVLLQEADFFFPMGCASQAGGGGGGSASGGGGGQQQRYVVGIMPAKKLGECVQGVAQMVG